MDIVIVESENGTLSNPVFKDEATAIASLKFSYHKMKDVKVVEIDRNPVRTVVSLTYRSEDNHLLVFFFKLNHYRLTDQIEHL
jgi:hypothetical protein